MPFIPHTESETREMLDAIGWDRIEYLFDEIPQRLRCGDLQIVPTALSEFQSMMTALTAVDVSNASLCDGALALAEAV